MEDKGMLNDSRLITGIFWDDAAGSCFRVPESADRIEAYGEPGMHCDIPFLRVIKDGQVIFRVPAIQVQVSYN